MIYKLLMPAALLAAVVTTGTGAGAATVSAPAPASATDPASTVAAKAADAGLWLQPDRTTLLDFDVVGSSLVAVGERGVVFRSNDQGKSWLGMLTGTSRTLTAVAFRDPRVGVAVGHGGSVLRTEDGGTSWAVVSVPEIGRDAVLGVTALEDGRFIACGAFGMYLVSADQGKTWRRDKVIADDFDRHISKVVQVGPSLMLVAESGIVARSTDGGSHWTQLAMPYEGSYFGILPLKSGAVLVFGMRGNVFRSRDQGLTWEKVAFASKATLNGGSIARDGRVVLSGNRGLIAVSTDDGVSFRLIQAPQSTSLSQARIVEDGSLVYTGHLAVGRLPTAAVSSRSVP